MPLPFAVSAGIIVPHDESPTRPPAASSFAPCLHGWNGLGLGLALKLYVEWTARQGMSFALQTFRPFRGVGGAASVAGVTGVVTDGERATEIKV